MRACGCTYIPIFLATVLVMARNPSSGYLRLNNVKTSPRSSGHSSVINRSMVLPRSTIFTNIRRGGMTMLCVCVWRVRRPHSPLPLLPPPLHIPSLTPPPHSSLPSSLVIHLPPPPPHLPPLPPTRTLEQ